ncbi:hypothetical protein HPG69_002738 [Diceros bicornis minor]|uniref:HIN-200 domain-containing protein n=1 Tax=Diceros bicornis minor TaxID=77932 RepID=A0A7J7FMV2_DICBM|nr:hypothetical protein HPG69_002738 [Diceros bicornis minor]
MSPGASAAPRNGVMEQHTVQPEQKQMVQQESIKEEGLQKGPVIVIVLKTMKSFEFETQEGKQEMFHATVTTECEFFSVKVFNKKLKDKSTPKKIIITSKYYRHTRCLEVNSASLWLMLDLTNRPINRLPTQPPGTIVNGLIVLQKVYEAEDTGY